MPAPHNVGIGVAKDLLDLVHILTKPRIRTKNVRSAVVVRDIAGGRCHTRRVNHGEDHDGSGDTDLEHQTGELTQRRDKGPVLRFLHKAIELNEHRRNKGKDRYQADGDTLCKGKTKVGADLKLHGGKRDKADADRATARKHGDRGQAARLHHVFGNAAVAATLLVKAVQQKDREVQRDGNLQNGARRVGDKANLAKDEVGAPVDKHRDAQAQQHQDGFGPAGSRDDQNHEDNRYDSDRDNADLLLGRCGGERVRHGRARNGALVAHDISNSVGCLDLLFGINRHRKQGVVLFVIGLNGVFVLRGKRLIDICRVVKP